MPFSLIPFLLLAVPIVEIAVFILIGDQIGVFYTLAMIFVTAVLGSILLRIQGFQIIASIRAETAKGRIPGRDLGNGAMILVAGILLLTPGFVTDGLGFLLFIPPVRALIWSVIAKSVSFTPPTSTPFSHRVDPVTGNRDDESIIIDLDDDEYSSELDSESPWNKK